MQIFISKSSFSSVTVLSRNSRAPTVQTYPVDSDKMDDFREHRWSGSYLPLLAGAPTLAFSVLSLFRPVFALTADSCASLFPFLTNLFCEPDFPMFAVSLALLPALSAPLRAHIGARRTAALLLGTGYACNTAIFALLRAISAARCAVGGALPMLVAASVALLHLGGRHRVGVARAAFEAPARAIFAAVGVWVVLCVRRDCGPALSGLLAYPLSFAALRVFRGALGVEIDDDLIERLLRPPAAEPAPLLGALGFAQDASLSEAEQSRRIRALRAIEERLESI